MKKWSGGILIIVLAMVLVLRYSLMENQSQKHSAYSFFRNHPTNSSHLEDKGAIKPSQKQEIRNRLKRPNLINVEGLSDLYSPTNFSVEESRFMVVWAQMRFLLARSDSLPETAQGVKEASNAWKELLATIDEKSFRFMNSSEPRCDAENENCPFSVSMLDNTISSDGVVLNFPCGLVDGSSITVIGIPDVHRGGFQIELIGSQLKGEPKPPIILHYNVTLPGNKLIEDPVIVQNMWSTESGWGKEERCPARGSTSNLKVDGLVRCNEQIIRTVVGENLGGIQPNSSKRTNASEGTSQISVVNFPFVEGNPFTATVWVGSEGFHMTVNGRHETSFAYREKFEPWLVSGVKVAGGLSLLSALANGLPVSEDLDVIGDAEDLKAPPVSKKRLKLLVGVFSTGNNFERRMALRRSWMQYKAVRSGDVAVRFFVGLQKNKQVNIKLWRESQFFGDIQLVPFVDYYSLITLKTIAICILGIKILPAKYIMKTDDDAFVRIDEVLSSLEGKVSNGLLYGRISFDSEPQRDRDSKWYINVEEWPHASYPPWAHGPGYIISRDIAKFIVQGHQEGHLMLFKLEDVALGIWIEQFKKSGQEVHYINDDRFYNTGCESDYVLAHYQGPRLVLCLWEKLQVQHQPLCCE
ncbi:hydroxyproline O-galactosyltransferase GALT3 [Telopea speciosissima]|uniref:hydroxyproline O-galactosyltransferase GALT3 n=1 Tax=Telopea speciosissima TaxID=54955 RepID=UPI001CC578E6|nr:hydroxyproline O-galactosyltransferase GALT3 [Telopea speciosissima]